MSATYGVGLPNVWTRWQRFLLRLAHWFDPAAHERQVRASAELHRRADEAVKDAGRQARMLRSYQREGQALRRHS